MAKSMGMNLASGLQGMLKDGHNSYEGVDEAIMRNINAAKELAAIVRTSLGPNGEPLSYLGIQNFWETKQGEAPGVWLGCTVGHCCCQPCTETNEHAPLSNRSRRISGRACRDLLSRAHKRTVFFLSNASLPQDAHRLWTLVLVER